MLPRIDSGVKAYIWAHATVRVCFPVDFRDNAYVCCRQCPFYRDNSRICSLNKEVCEFPEKSIGSKCPLEFDEKEAENV